MSRRDELVAKVTALVAREHGGDWRKAFAKYDADKDARISWDELADLLTAAKVGGKWTLRLFVGGVFRELDADADGFISWAEFEAAFDEGGDCEPGTRPRERRDEVEGFGDGGAGRAE